jgi:hypothetical protein
MKKITVRLMETSAVKKKSKRVMYNFKKITYDKFEHLDSGNSERYEETYIDGYLVMALYDSDNAKSANCIAMYYNKAGIASHCPEFKGDAVAYSERDTNWPYGN